MKAFGETNRAEMNTSRHHTARSQHQAAAFAILHPFSRQLIGADAAENQSIRFHIPNSTQRRKCAQPAFPCNKHSAWAPTKVRVPACVALENRSALIF